MGRPMRQKGRKRAPKRCQNRPKNDPKTMKKSIKFRDDLFGAKTEIDLRTRRIGRSSLGRPSPPGTCPGTPFRAFKKTKKCYNTTILQRKYKKPRDQGTQGPRDQGIQGTKLGRPCRLSVTPWAYGPANSPYPNPTQTLALSLIHI